MTSEILAFDPGETTGFVVMLDDWPPNNNSVVTTSNLRGEKEICAAYFTALDLAAHPPVVVVESFKLFPHMAKQQIGSSFPSCEVIGMLRILAFLANLDICFQPPSVQKNWPSESLKKYGFNTSNLSLHQLSALKHALQWAKVNYEKSRSSFSKKR